MNVNRHESYDNYLFLLIILFVFLISLKIGICLFTNSCMSEVNDDDDDDDDD